MNVPEKVELDRIALWGSQPQNLERARKITLAFDYDYLFIVESDMIVPPHSLNGLLEADADVAVGLYRIRKTEHFCHVINGRFIVLEKDFTHNQTMLPVDRLGLGCVLLTRKVVEAVPFPLKAEGIDIEYSDRVKNAGFKVVCNCQVRCGHIDRDGSVYGAL